MNVIGLDLSLTNTGIVQIIDNTVTDYTLVKSSPSANPYTRLNTIVDEIVKWITQRDSVDLIIIEGIAFSSNGKATRTLSGLHYMVVCQLIKLGYDTKIVTPTELKKPFTGRCKSSKVEVIDCVT